MCDPIGTVVSVKRHIAAYLFVAPAFLYVLVLMVYPLLYNVHLSAYDVSLVSFIRGNSPFVGLGNYWKVVRDPLFHRVLFNTVVFTVGSIFFQFTLGLLLALLFEKRFPMKGLYQGLLMLPWFIPIMVSGTVFRWFFADGGTLNSILRGFDLIDYPVPWTTSARMAIYSLTAANVWLGVPFNFILLLTGLQAIPTELYECAAIDGAKEWQRVVYVSLPLLRPVIVTTLMLGAIFTVKVFDLVWVITKGGPGGSSHLFSTFSYSLAFEQFRFGSAAAVALMMVLLVTAVTVAFQRVRLEE